MVRLRSDELSVRALGDEVVLLDLRSSRYLSVTGVGVDIVGLLAEDRDEDRIVETLLEHYDVPEDVLRADTRAFLSELRAGGLLE